MSFQDKLEKAVSNFILPERGGITIMKDEMKPTPPTFREMAERVAETIEKNNIDWATEIESALKLAASESRKEEIEECAQLMETKFHKVSRFPTYDPRYVGGDLYSPFAEAIRAIAQKDKT